MIALAWPFVAMVAIGMAYRLARLNALGQRDADFLHDKLEKLVQLEKDDYDGMRGECLTHSRAIIDLNNEMQALKKRVNASEVSKLGGQR